MEPVKRKIPGPIRIISLIVVIAFTFNQLAYGLSPWVGSPQVYKRMLEKGINCQAAEGPGFREELERRFSTAWVGGEPELPLGVRFIEPDYEHLPSDWSAKEELYQNTTLVGALNFSKEEIAEAIALKFHGSKDKALVSKISSQLTIKEAYYEIESDKSDFVEAKGEIPEGRLELTKVDGKDKWTLIVETRLAQMWAHKRKNDTWLKWQDWRSEDVTSSAAFGIFEWIKRHYLSGIKNGEFRNTGHITLTVKDLPNISEDEMLANAIDGRRFLANYAIKLWFIASYAFGNSTRYNNDLFRDRCRWILTSSQAETLGIRQQFPEGLEGGQIDSIISIACGINYDSFGRRNIGFPELKISDELKDEYEARKTKIEKTIYAGGAASDAENSIIFLGNIRAADFGIKINFDVSKNELFLEIIENQKPDENEWKAIRNAAMAWYGKTPSAQTKVREAQEAGKGPAVGASTQPKQQIKVRVAKPEPVLLGRETKDGVTVEVYYAANTKKSFLKARQTPAEAKAKGVPGAADMALVVPDVNAWIQGSVRAQTLIRDADRRYERAIAAAKALAAARANDPNLKQIGGDRESYQEMIKSLKGEADSHVEDIESHITGAIRKFYSGQPDKIKNAENFLRVFLEKYSFAVRSGDLKKMLQNLKEMRRSQKVLRKVVVISLSLVLLVTGLGALAGTKAMLGSFFITVFLACGVIFLTSRAQDDFLKSKEGSFLKLLVPVLERELQTIEILAELAAVLESGAEANIKADDIRGKEDDFTVSKVTEGKFAGWYYVEAPTALTLYFNRETKEIIFGHGMQAEEGEGAYANLESVKVHYDEAEGVTKLEFETEFPGRPDPIEAHSRDELVEGLISWQEAGVIPSDDIVMITASPEKNFQIVISINEDENIVSWNDNYGLKLVLKKIALASNQSMKKKTASGDAAASAGPESDEAKPSKLYLRKKLATIPSGGILELGKAKIIEEPITLDDIPLIAKVDIKFTAIGFVASQEELVNLQAIPWLPVLEKQADAITLLQAMAKGKLFSNDRVRRAL